MKKIHSVLSTAKPGCLERSCHGSANFLYRSAVSSSEQHRNSYLSGRHGQFEQGT
jgi:hypothetical protein